jgi:indolepyruvate ferredoxin oxidoreductase beta subunit
MNYDIVLSGVGGQGALSVARVIASAARRSGLSVLQSEIHGMSQRGGAVVAQLRLSDRPMSSPMIPKATAAMILSMEPLEGLRHIGYLSPKGILVTSKDPVRSIPGYPRYDDLLARIASLPRHELVEAGRLAREAGSVLATNVVMVGAASRLLPLETTKLEACIRDRFAHQEKILAINLRAFRAGREALQETCIESHSPL